jgi:hypothetical protein
VGDEDFFAILRAWAAERRNSTGTTTQFQELAERISHRNLEDLFAGWLFTAGKPAACASTPSVSVARVERAPVFRRFESWFSPAGLLK